MATSFNGIPIFVLADDVPKDIKADITVRHIPGGDISHIDLGGALLKQLVYTLLFLNGTDLLTFEGQLSQIGTLITFDGTFTALLSEMRRVAHGAMAGGEAVAQCTFLLL